MQGANTTTFKALLQHFQVEELEERLENKWRTCHCPVESGSAAEGNYKVTYVECDC
jgi:hypothetical protein